MKSATTVAVSGCVFWVIAFAVFSTCPVPPSFMEGGFTSESSFTVRVVGPIICPHGKTGQIYSYNTTMPEKNGFPTAATGYELHCMDATGNIVKNDPIVLGLPLGRYRRRSDPDRDRVPGFRIG